MKYGPKLGWFIVIVGILFGYAGVSSIGGTVNKSASTFQPSPSTQVAGETITATPIPSIETSTIPAPTIVPSPTPSLSPSPSLRPSPSTKPSTTPKPSPIPSPEVQKPKTLQQTSKFSCSCAKTCEQISSCEEAQYQLNVCGCSVRDGDKDGIACDSAPLKCQN